MIVLVGAYTVTNLAGAPAAIAAAVGRPRIEAEAGALAVALQFGVMLPLGAAFGFRGVLAGAAVALVIPRNVAGRESSPRPSDLAA